MRLLITSILFSHFTYAAEIVTKSPLVTLGIKGKYKNEFTQIFQDKNEWFCKTEINPYFVSPKRPYDPLVLKNLREGKIIPHKFLETCTAKYILIDHSQKISKTIRGCTNDHPFRNFLRYTNQHCGRN